MTHNYGTQCIGERIYVYREPDEIIGWMDREYTSQPRHERRGAFRMIVQPETDWTGRWVAVACCDAHLGTVASPAEGLLMISRVTELHDQAVLGPF